MSQTCLSRKSHRFLVGLSSSQSGSSGPQNVLEAVSMNRGTGFRSSHVSCSDFCLVSKLSEPFKLLQSLRVVSSDDEDPHSSLREER